MTNVSYKTAAKPAVVAPFIQANVTNGNGYKNLVVNKNSNGKAIRINLADGSERVNVTLDAIPDLIEALQAAASHGIATSVSNLEFAA